MTVILFLAVLFVLILVHELGHFAVAKWSKMRVDEFAIGFPPRLFVFKKGETQYSLNALPIGGYVKIFGEDGSGTALSEDERRRAFGSRPYLAQIAVLVAGVAMNVLIAWMIFVAVGLIGQPTIVEEGGQHSAGAELTITNVLPESPAEEANIPLGAKVVALRAGTNELRELTPSAFINFIGNHGHETITLTYNHKGKEATVELVPEAGVIADDPNRPAIGLAADLVNTLREDPITAVWGATVKTGYYLQVITVGVIGFLGSAFVFDADLTQVTGPVGIANMVGDAAEFGFVSLLLFTAFISLNLAVINLLPIPALDGGRILFVVAEMVMRRKIDPIWMSRVNLIGFGFLILLMVLVTYNDVIKIL